MHVHQGNSLLVSQLLVTLDALASCFAGVCNLQTQITPHPLHTMPSYTQGILNLLHVVTVSQVIHTGHTQPPYTAQTQVTPHPCLHTTRTQVTSAKELTATIEGGLNRRHVASTQMNRESSRSHLIISIVIESTNLQVCM